MADSSHRWFLALGGAALLLSASLGGLVLLRKRRGLSGSTAASAQPLPELPGGACGPQRSEYHPLPDAESPPVILWAAGAARLYVDEQPAYSPPERPKRFAPGEHTVRIEAPGEEAIHTRIRVDPFTPVLLHAQADPQFGLSLVRFGATCLPCEPPPSAPVDLSPARKPAPTSAALLAAAGHLRHDRWTQAVDGIRRASVADRKRPIFYRLAAITAENDTQHDLARALLGRIPPAQSNDLATLLPIFDKLVTSEVRRRKDVTLERWNKITEWFAEVSDKYQGDAASPVSAATKRFSQLSLVFDTAVREGTVDQQAEVVRSGEQTLTSLIKDLRAQKPEDCGFQGELSAVGAR